MTPSQLQSSLSSQHNVPDDTSSTNKQTRKDPDTHDDDDDDDEDDYTVSALVTSMRSATGLETGVRVHWPGLTQPLPLNTCLPETEMAPMFHGTQWAGTRVWRAALVALQYLTATATESETADDNNDTSMDATPPILFQLCNQTTPQSTISILELGCGLGVPGMVLHALYPDTCDVVLTDQEALLEPLRSNIAKLVDATHATATTIRAEALDWTESIHQWCHRMGYEHGFDVVLNCDCIYEPLYGDSWKDLCKCQTDLLRLRPSTVMLTVVERRAHDGVDLYLHAIAQSDAVSHVTRIPFTSSAMGNVPPEIEIYRIYGHTDAT
jgi:hypothetical protein